MLWRSLILSILVLSITATPGAWADWVRDEIRINMRTGPGQQYRILRVLQSGDEVTRLSQTENWVSVRTPDGEEGWVPAGYVTAEMPASTTLPRTQAKLAQSEARIEELEAKLATQTEDVKELAELRARNTELSTENTQLVGATRWKTMGMGALIALGGLVLGILWPRGGTARTRRIKL